MALTVAGFKLWIQGRQFPDSTDYSDGNWLLVSARCEAPGAIVRAQGALLMVTDIAEFGDQCKAMHEGDTKSAKLDPLEPELSLSLEGVDLAGHITATVEITADHLSQYHKMEFEIDQSYLPDIVSQCATILREYPIRGRNEGQGT